RQYFPYSLRHSLGLPQPLRESFFFFQAEDGIRDFHVTGVQTCALPDLDREERFWKVDKSIFHPKVRTSLRRLAAMARSIGKIVLFLLLFSYPILLVYMGIQYGGIVFWSTLGGSFIMIGLILSKAGYAGNFQSRNGSLAKGLAG